MPDETKPMVKPDFGIGAGRYYTIKWTAERIAYVRSLADRRMSAADIAADIGLNRSQGPRIAAVCKRYGVQLAGLSGRPSQIKAGRFAVRIPERFSALIHRLSVKHGVSGDDLALQAVTAMLEQGDAFIENLLDLGTTE